MWTLRRRQRGRCAMPAPRPGAFTFMIVNASVAGKYALYIVFFTLIYPHSTHKLHSKRKERKQRMTHHRHIFYFYHKQITVNKKNVSL
jgi:hypothetical protein